MGPNLLPNFSGTSALNFFNVDVTTFLLDIKQIDICLLRYETKIKEIF